MHQRLEYRDDEKDQRKHPYVNDDGLVNWEVFR